MAKGNIIVLNEEVPITIKEITKYPNGTQILLYNISEFPVTLFPQDQIGGVSSVYQLIKVPVIDANYIIPAGGFVLLFSYSDYWVVDGLRTEMLTNYATEANAGILEVANESETLSLSVNDKIITPAKLNILTATEARKGLLEVADSAEAIALSVDNKIMTPVKVALLKASNDNIKNNVSDKFVEPSGLLIHNDWVNITSFGTNWSQYSTFTVSYKKMNNGTNYW